MTDKHKRWQRWLGLKTDLKTRKILKIPARLFVLLVIGVIITSTVLALTFLGPPTTVNQKTRQATASINNLNPNPFWGDLTTFMYWNATVATNTYAITIDMRPSFIVTIGTCADLVLEISLDNVTWSTPLTTVDISSVCNYDPGTGYQINVPAGATGSSYIWYMRHKFADFTCCLGTVGFSVQLTTG